MHSICWVKHIRADKTTSLGKFFKECYKMKAEVSHFTILKSSSVICRDNGKKDMCCLATFKRTITVGLSILT